MEIELRISLKEVFYVAHQHKLKSEKWTPNLMKHTISGHRSNISLHTPLEIVYINIWGKPENSGLPSSKKSVLGIVDFLAATAAQEANLALCLCVRSSPLCFFVTCFL